MVSTATYREQLETLSRASKTAQIYSQLLQLHILYQLERHVHVAQLTTQLTQLSVECRVRPEVYLYAFVQQLISMFSIKDVGQ